MPDGPALYRWAVSPPKPLRREAFIPFDRQTYPGRTDETERAFEGDTMSVDSDQILAQLVTRHRSNYPELATVTPPNSNPHLRGDDETARWNAYNLGRLHAFIEALNAVRTAAAGKDIGP